MDIWSNGMMDNVKLIGQDAICSVQNKSYNLALLYSVLIALCSMLYTLSFFFKYKT